MQETNSEQHKTNHLPTLTQNYSRSNGGLGVGCRGPLSQGSVSPEESRSESSKPVPPPFSSRGSTFSCSTKPCISCNKSLRARSLGLCLARFLKKSLTRNMSTTGLRGRLRLWPAPTLSDLGTFGAPARNGTSG